MIGRRCGEERVFAISVPVLLIGFLGCLCLGVGGLDLLCPGCGLTFIFGQFASFPMCGDWSLRG